MLPKTWITPGKVSNGSVGMHFSVQFIQQCIAFAQTGIPPLKILKNAVFCEWIEPPSPSLSLGWWDKDANHWEFKKSLKKNKKTGPGVKPTTSGLQLGLPARRATTAPRPHDGERSGRAPYPLSQCQRESHWLFISTPEYLAFWVFVFSSGIL